MIVINRNPRWQWRPDWAQERKGCYTYCWLTWGTLQVTVINNRLGKVVQEQVRAAIQQKNQSFKSTQKMAQ